MRDTAGAVSREALAKRSEDIDRAAQLAQKWLRAGGNKGTGLSYRQWPAQSRLPALGLVRQLAHAPEPALTPAKDWAHAGLGHPRLKPWTPDGRDGAGDLRRLRA